MLVVECRKLRIVRRNRARNLSVALLEAFFFFPSSTFDYNSLVSKVPASHGNDYETDFGIVLEISSTSILEIG